MTSAAVNAGEAAMSKTISLLPTLSLCSLDQRSGGYGVAVGRERIRFYKHRQGVAQCFRRIRDTLESS